MRIDGDWLAASHVQGVLAMLRGGGHRALLVGGCVRNALMDLPVADIDIATDALPLRVVELAQAAGFHPVPTGVDHGTVTVVADHHPHEVTTFRRDVATDGRRATVAFSRDVAQDAARRDFTMNALYAEADGTVIDPIGGLGDLKARRIRFVGDPAARIGEDYLRILRFFRFHACYGDPHEGLDPEGLAACAALAEGIGRLSRERVGQEMRKLLGAPDPAPSLAAMQAAGVLHRVLPGADPAAIGPLVHLEDGLHPDWRRRLAALGAGGEEAALRLSRDEARWLEDARAGLSGGAGPAELGYRNGADTARDVLLLRAAMTGQPMPPDWQEQSAWGAAARFPVVAADLMPALQGRALGARLKEIEARWIASDFRLSREQLLA